MRSRMWMAGALVATVVVAGCGSDGSDGADVSGSSGARATVAEDGAFPVTIEGALGSVTLDEQPARVATWGWSTQDAVLALGVVPVAMPLYTYGGDEDGVLPWDAEAIEALGGETPALLDGGESGAVPFEQFAAAEPDVILAPYSGLTQAEYDKLSRIAPVVAYPDQPWATSWQDQLTITGQALGMPQAAADLLDDVDADVTSLGEQYDALQGTSFLYAAANEPGQLSVYRTDDPRVELLAQLGMEPSASIDELDPSPEEGTYFYTLSYENVGRIDTDVLVAYFDDQKAADDFAADPVIAKLDAVKGGHFAPIVGQSFVMASSAPTALSIPWMLDQYVPQLAKAAEHG